MNALTYFRERPKWAFVITFGIMAFAPWIYFVVPSSNPHVFLLPYAAGIASGVALMPRGKEETLFAVFVATGLLIPAHLLGHLIGDAVGFCYLDI